ncbi:hypothetical protein L6R52_34720 [Myxococcota bacterium]|nr:hypothetical protein [Myxococcota bacterium]
MVDTTIEEGSVPVVPSEDDPRIIYMRWAAIFGGAVAALGVWALLYALGLALGLSAVNPNDPSSLRSSGIFTGIWGLVAPLVALFVGGLVASRAAGVVQRTGGILHGFVMWGLTTVLGAWLLASLIGSVVGGVVGIGKTAIQSGSEVASGAAAGGVGQGDAADLRARLEQQLQSARTQADQQMQGSRTQALEAADTTGKAFWGVFGSLALGLIAAIAGGALGVSRAQRETVERAVTPQYGRRRTLEPSPT